MPTHRLRIALVIALIASMAAACRNADDETTTSLAGSSTTSAAGVTTTAAGGATTTSADTGGGDAGDVDPCSLLTASDIQTATGLAYGEGVLNETLSEAGLGACDWSAATEFATVQTLIMPREGAYESNRASADEVLGVTDVSVPGADAAYQTADGAIVGMNVSGVFLQVGNLTTNPDVAAQTLQLAAIAVANL